MLNIITIILYLTGTLAQGSRWISDKDLAYLWPLFVFPAVICHGTLLYRWIDLSAGQNLTQFNLLSLALWLTAVMVILLSIKRPLAYLCLLIFPLAAFSILLANQFPAAHILQATDPIYFWHIILSVITFSVLSLAGLQAITLAFQNIVLKRRHFEISQSLPPIETMEKLLFAMIAIGAIFLTVLLSTSIYFFHASLLENFLQKTILTSLAWLVFIFLLVGRYYFGWRGRKAILCTLSGVTLLTITYFSSLFIIGLIP